MTLNEQLERIKVECREIIFLGDLAKKGPWRVNAGGAVQFRTSSLQWRWLIENSESHTLHQCDANFIAHSRTFTPAAAQATLVAIEALEKLACLGNGDRWGNSDGNVCAQSSLQTIVGNWTFQP